VKHPKESVSQKLPPEEELKHFKNVVRSAMDDASKALGFIELYADGAEIEEQIRLLDHYIDYTKRLCEGDKVRGISHRTPLGFPVHVRLSSRKGVEVIE